MAEKSGLIAVAAKPKPAVEKSSFRHYLPPRRRDLQFPKIFQNKSPKLCHSRPPVKNTPPLAAHHSTSSPPPPPPYKNKPREACNTTSRGLVTSQGFEPWTHALEGRCSNPTELRSRNRLQKYKFYANLTRMWEKNRNSRKDGTRSSALRLSA